jgi:transposase
VGLCGSVCGSVWVCVALCVFSSNPLLHDNASVHKANVTDDTIRECKFKILDQPPYSSDLAPGDFYLFAKLKKELRGEKIC